MLWKPDLVVAAANQVTPQLLRARSLRAVMVDMDDTLLESKQLTLKPEFLNWVASLKQAGFPTLILSNGTRKRVQSCAAELDVKGLALSGKPLPQAFKRGLKTLGCEASETAMVGDQLFTDVVGANLAGLTSILVTPLGTGGLPHTRFIRHIEAWLLAKTPISEHPISEHPVSEHSTSEQLSKHSAASHNERGRTWPFSP